MKKLFLLLIVVTCSILSFAQTTINMEKKGNVFYVPGKVNGLQLEFIFDTGASNVCLSLTEAYFMLKNGYLNESDLGVSSYSQIANGQIVENMNVNLRQIEIGGITLKNIPAIIMKNLDAPLLFGQSAIQELGPIQLNGNQLIISRTSNLPNNESAFALYQKAFQESEAGNYDKAIQLSEQALALSTDKKLKAMLYDNIAYAYYHSNRHSEAIEALNAALGEDIMSEQPGYNLGVYYYEMGQTAKSLRAFNNFIERHKEPINKDFLGAAYAYKGDCHRKNGEIKDAEMAYKQSLSIIPNVQAMLGLADLYLDSNKYGDAIPLYTSALEYEPKRMSNIKRHHQLGYCYARLNKNNEALNSFRNCISAIEANWELIGLAIKSEDKETQNTASFNAYLGFTAKMWIARLTNDPSETIRNYEQIFEIPTISNEFIYRDFLNWASAYTRNGKNPHSKAKALEILGKGLKIHPENPDLLFYCALYSDPSSEERLNYLTRILASEYSYEPTTFDYGTVYNNIAWYYTLNKQYDKGLQYALNAIKLNPEHDYSWETLGELYFFLGQYQKCIDAMTECININDRCQSALEFRAKSYRELGMKKEANKDEEKLGKIRK